MKLNLTLILDYVAIFEDSFSPLTVKCQNMAQLLTETGSNYPKLPVRKPVFPTVYYYFLIPSLFRLVNESFMKSISF